MVKKDAEKGALDALKHLRKEHLFLPVRNKQAREVLDEISQKTGVGVRDLINFFQLLGEDPINITPPVREMEEAEMGEIALKVLEYKIF